MKTKTKIEKQGFEVVLIDTLTGISEGLEALNATLKQGNVSTDRRQHNIQGVLEEIQCILGYKL